MQYSISIVDRNSFSQEAILRYHPQDITALFAYGRLLLWHKWALTYIFHLFVVMGLMVKIAISYKAERHLDMKVAYKSRPRVSTGTVYERLAD